MPKTGRNLHRHDHDLAFPDLMAHALVDDLGDSHRAAKTLMRWTGASERSVKHWLAGTHSPRGTHLITLMRNSDSVTRHVLAAAGRHDLVIALEVNGIRSKLTHALALLDNLG